MKYIWSYIMMTLCMAFTSARVIDFPGNREDFHDNIIPAMKEEKVLTPPSDNALNIDSNGFPGNSNEHKENVNNCKELCLKGKGENSCLCHWPAFLKEIFYAMENRSNEYQIIPFQREEIINLKDSDICKTMCSYGVHQPPCECE